MNAGHPPRTKCVVVRSNGAYRIGMIVFTGELVLLWKHGNLHTVPGLGVRMMNGAPDCDGMIMQEIKRTADDDITVYPVTWMRPIDQDIDETDLEVLLALTLPKPVARPIKMKPEGEWR